MIGKAKKKYGGCAVNIKVNAVFPPIPIRSLDYEAYDADTYDASYDGEDENGHHWKSSPLGHGATPQEAIDDLKSQMEAQ